ncbi:hypothetical protein SF06_10640 [Pseudomonas flexibilis]|uniref:Uncharacterized protein n=1 Tax=Pseudomonas flexibilis TaxID=706570 RepID=A0A1N6PML6_9PSED|nr:hypothetical protein [Pseudomonas flexibilis]KHL69974.1 hypothetical protein SF06_10640 [Pseudomonas flexibilis]SIQ05546.1 hypothetical protein SAMN05421672_102226 [Pseudomonas flexibilis]
MIFRHFEHYEAVASALPVEDGYQAVIAVKTRDPGARPVVHTLAEGHRYDLAFEAEEVAHAALAKLKEISREGELLWE